ncbi:MAG: lysoplasmalogenase [Clostridia bacterium]|nr:lysoplasmalogenase [Clostridia bacterium]
MNKTSQKTVLSVNIIIIALVFVLNYFYQASGFDFTLKCICSGGFALLGLINLGYGVTAKRGRLSFFVCMATGLLLAMLGDVLIKFDFITGAVTFAIGHIFFIAAYCFLWGIEKLDVIYSGALFIGTFIFLEFCPLLSFSSPAFKWVCIAYALIISVMLGKAAGNFTRTRTALTLSIAIASALFFFSDLMLVLDRFIGLWDWTANACMGTYYPALCLLAFSMLLCSFEKSSAK